MKTMIINPQKRTIRLNGKHETKYASDHTFNTAVHFALALKLDRLEPELEQALMDRLTKSNCSKFI